MNRKWIFITLLSAASFAISAERIPAPMREMRGVWVATVANIDWPSRPGLNVEAQQQEAKAILDRVKTLNMNAVVLQVRPQADALYASELEPWSYFLTGAQGKEPDPYYDPLSYWIAEAHARGLELHAWFNPYRANHPAMGSEISAKSIIKTHPGWVHKLGDTTYYWMDPAITSVQDHSFAVVMDVVKRYDIDGVQFDDYFYPYREYNNGQDFPDETTYQAYRQTGGNLARDDWRRDAVNRFIERIYQGIKKRKPWVKFGVSPFGIYRPGFPESIGGGFDQYAVLFADARLWLNKGWVDYFTPQLYWPISRVAMSFPVLLGWWSSENTHRRNLWPGLYIRPEVDSTKMILEIVNQVMVARGMVPESPGTILFSMKSLMKTDSTADRALRTGPFIKPALMPAYSWLDHKAPKPPRVTAVKKADSLHVTWVVAGKEKPVSWVFYFKTNGKWRYEILPGGTTSTTWPLSGTAIDAMAVSAVDRCGNESERKVIPIVFEP